MIKKDPLSYTTRSYRNRVDSGSLTSTRVTVQETDLHILAETDVRRASHDLICTARNQVEAFIAQQPDFLTSLVPLAPAPLATPLIQTMLSAARIANIGPMGAVAGAIAEFVGTALIQSGITAEVMVENGGDVFLQRRKQCCIGIFAGQSPLSHKIGLDIQQGAMPLGICSSSGSIGHSLSFGNADAVTVLAKQTAIADTVATRLGNEMQDDINHVLEVAKTFQGSIMGVVVIKDTQLGAWGEIELVNL